MRVYHLFRETLTPEGRWPTIEDYLGECIEWSDGKVTARWRKPDTNTVYEGRYVYEEETFDSMAAMVMPSNERHFTWEEAGVLDAPETILKYMKHKDKLLRDLKAARNHTLTMTLKIALPEDEED